MCRSRADCCPIRPSGVVHDSAVWVQGPRVRDDVDDGAPTRGLFVRLIANDAAPRCGCGTWLGHWRAHGGRASPRCSIAGCGEAADLAVTAIHRDSPDRFVVPVCRDHAIVCEWMPAAADAAPDEQGSRPVVAPRSSGSGRRPARRIWTRREFRRRDHRHPPCPWCPWGRRRVLPGVFRGVVLVDPTGTAAALTASAPKQRLAIRGP